MSKSPFDIHQYRQYATFNDANYGATFATWLSTQNFNVVSHTVTGMTRQMVAHGKGIHVNHMPVLKLDFAHQPTGISVHCHYTCELKVATAAVAGFFTSGVSLAVGAGTGAKHALEAEEFVRSIWHKLD
eukprot:CAMPEP_0198341196 /NCGR_PEP_ID=MMETSP1450-20131203/46830_1 /TAXON_ID=753684 ORGANISM="Madagascaria erythrocladiodes, Strain CCMP3234" /NCGR_SAMPLE_ID=MMETSP1450 /ASSEMBLY_ACC=CAM_ASM_001115 /LENGTH=128 /DNA_ID=CAMNT_0044046207 /DNA_START=37 /DNA_END=420 /DNA_ORIENTATION=+